MFSIDLSRMESDLDYRDSVLYVIAHAIHKSDNVENVVLTYEVIVENIPAWAKEC